jgi:3-hydroxyacyl-[acyl-carrier-protein] dehydratase
MKLINSLYKVVSKNVSGSSLRYDILLDAGHFIYQVHFPGEPITPGVCIIQIAKELLEAHLNLVLHIRKIKNVKFLNVISPVERPQISYVFEKITVDDAAKTCQAQVLVLSDETPMAKLSFTCETSNEGDDR